MRVNRRARAFVTLVATMMAVVAFVQCGGAASPTAPTSTTPTVSGVALSAASVTAGGTAQGTVTLSSNASTGGASIALSSSNTGVASVQTSIAIAAGSSSATFTVTAVSAGTATITASLGGTGGSAGSNGHSPMLTVTARPVTLASIALSAASVAGGGQVIGNVTLSGAAPAGGAVVSLSSVDPISVPESVTVAAGSRTATFTIATRTVGGTFTGTIAAAYGGVSASAALSVTQPLVATASFGVASQTESETCKVMDGGSALNCAFNGTTSTAPGRIIAWDWSYGVSTSLALTTSGPVLAVPPFDCALLPPAPLPPGNQWFTLTITLRVRDDLGNVSALAVNNDARVIPQGACGF